MKRNFQIVEEGRWQWVASSANQAEIKRNSGCTVLLVFSTYPEDHGQYTRDRHLWLDGVTIEEVLAELPPA